RLPWRITSRLCSRSFLSGHLTCASRQADVLGTLRSSQARDGVHTGAGRLLQRHTATSLGQAAGTPAVPPDVVAAPLRPQSRLPATAGAFWHVCPDGRARGLPGGQRPALAATGLAGHIVSRDRGDVDARCAAQAAVVVLDGE